MSDDCVEFLAEIMELCSDDEGRWDFARTTLDGIYETVQQSERVTEAQRRAVTNIRNGGLKGSRRNSWREDMLR